MSFGWREIMCFIPNVIKALSATAKFCKVVRGKKMFLCLEERFVFRFLFLYTKVLESCTRNAIYICCFLERDYSIFYFPIMI